MTTQATEGSDRPTIAVIGVGRMGGGVARSLARSGHFDVVVQDLDPAAVERCVSEGTRAATDAPTAAKGAAVVVTSLPLPHHVETMWRTLAAVLGPDGIAVDTSTIDPDTARTVADLVGPERFVSCLLGKGPAQAEAGEVPLFVGGPDAALDRLEPVFAAIGETVHRLGTVEAATTFKLVSNLIGMANLAVLAEGYAVCEHLGVAPDAFTSALADTGGWSTQAVVRLPWMIERDFAPRFAVDLGAKDLRLTVDLAARRGIPTPVGAAALSQLVMTAANGRGGDDVDAVLATVLGAEV